MAFSYANLHNDVPSGNLINELLPQLNEAAKNSGYTGNRDTQAFDEFVKLSKEAIAIINTPEGASGNTASKGNKQ